MIQPKLIRTAAVISYLKTNCSPSNLIERIPFNKIATEQVAVKRDKSAYGRTTIWSIAATITRTNPKSHLREKIEIREGDDEVSRPIIYPARDSDSG